ncbi:hypothetical protein O0L34_g14728 [Tuta absoluta]|nr:hypothetical protein O0L34_g14728 [Tuta absoluta]
MIQLRQIAHAAVKSVKSSKRCVSTNPGALVDLAVDSDGICTLTMQRPPVNSLNLELLQDLNQRLDEIAKDKIKGMVLTSAFPNVFTAGVDINEVVDPQIERLMAHGRALQDVWAKLFGSDFISTAAINGHALAGGCILALTCEYRVMVQNKKIGINDTIIGFVPAQWVVESARLAMSSRRAELALTTSDMYTTEEALQIGLVDETATDKEEAIEKCKQFIKKFDKIPSFARIETKKSIRGSILRLLTENKEAELKRTVEKATESRTQETVKRYFNELKSKKN